MILRWNAKVVAIVPRKRREWLGGMGAEARYREIEVGVSISFEGEGGEIFSLGFDERFGLAVDQSVIFRMESTDANPRPSSIE